MSNGGPSPYNGELQAIMSMCAARRRSRRIPTGMERAWAIFHDHVRICRACHIALCHPDASQRRITQLCGEGRDRWRGMVDALWLVAQPQSVTV